MPVKFIKIFNKLKIKKKEKAIHIGPVCKYLISKGFPKKEVLFFKTLTEYFFLILLFLSLRSSVFGNYRIPTGSMETTLRIGDHLFANKLAYSLKVPFTTKHLIRWNKPQRGEIISFKYPGLDFLGAEEKDTSMANFIKWIYNVPEYTKRIIGVPGDKISMKNNRLSINGNYLNLSYLYSADGYSFYQEDLVGIKHLVRFSEIHDPAFYPGSPLKKGRKTNPEEPQESMSYDQDSFDEITVPEGYYFAMGDNRDNSYDSRNWGFVPMNYIDGRLGFRFLHIEMEKHITIPILNKSIPWFSKISFKGFGLVGNERLK